MNEEEKKAIEKIKEIIECFYCFPNPTNIELKDCDCLTLEIALNLIEKLQKENEEWKRAYQEEKDKQFELLRKNMEEENLFKVKVKDKIEELKNTPLKIKENDKYYYETDAYNKIVVQVLQELLEGRK